MYVNRLPGIEAGTPLRQVTSFQPGLEQSTQDFFRDFSDGEVNTYLRTPGFSISQLGWGQTLEFTGRNPDKHLGNGWFTFFTQDCRLWFDREGLHGQLGSIGGSQPPSEEFRIESLHGSMDGRGMVAESGEARFKPGYFVTAHNVQFADGTEFPTITLAGQIMDYRIYDIPPNSLLPSPN